MPGSAARWSHGQRWHSVTREHGIDGKADLEADIGPHQRDQLAQQRLVRQETLEVGEVERSDAQDDSRLLVPGTHAGRCIDAQLAKSTGRQADPEARPLIDGQPEPGAGELFDFDRPPQPVGGQRFEPIR